jgi:hypothetical protein
MQWFADPGCVDGVDPVTCSSGNNYGCRRYHLDVANQSVTNAMTHCPHATPLSPETTDITIPSAVNGTVCVDTSLFTNNNIAINGLLADFCTQIIRTCQLYLGGNVSPASCVSTFQHVPAITDTSMYAGAAGRKFPLAATANENALWCRRYHVQVARTPGNAPEHCPHAIYGAGACGSNCDTYCAVVTGVCTGANSQYNGTSAMSDCMSACGGFRTSADYVNVTTGNTAQCRVYHASVASESAAAAATHCPHTGPSGGGVCVDADDDSAAAGVSASFVVVAALAILAKFSM